MSPNLFRLQHRVGVLQRRSCCVPTSCLIPFYYPISMIGKSSCRSIQTTGSRRPSSSHAISVHQYNKLLLIHHSTTSFSSPTPCSSLRISNIKYYHRRHCYSTSFTDSKASTNNHQRQYLPSECHYSLYKKVMVDTILNSRKYKSRKLSLIGQGLWSEETFQKFEGWLLQRKPVVGDKMTMLEQRWSHLRVEWMDTLLAADAKNSSEENETTISCNHISMKDHLTSQREVLQSIIFQSHHHQHHETPILLSLVSKSFSRLMQSIFHECVDYCLTTGCGGGESNRLSSILPVLWSKMKESGAIVKQARVALLINAAAASRGGVIIKSKQSTTADQEEVNVMEELVMYHDLLYDLSGLPLHKRYPIIIRYCCEVGDVDKALNLLRKLHSLDGSLAGKSELCMMVLATLAENGYFSRTSNGAKLFDEIASEMASHECEISSQSAMRLHNALAKEFETADAAMMEENKALVCRVQIDPDTGICPVTNTQIHSRSTLSPNQRKQMYQDILAMVQKQSSFINELEKFSRWMNTREGPPFTAILDGANIGRRIEPVFGQLKECGHNPLVILPQRKADAKRIKNFKRTNSIYLVPGGSDDDVFCIVGTVVEQERSRKGNPQLAEGRVVLITNDLFRDHKYEMRDPDLFDEWYTYQRCEDWSSRDDAQFLDEQSHKVLFTPQKQKQIHKDVLELAKRRSSAINGLKAFVNWMRNRKGPPFTVVIDGANVGSVESMVISLEAQGEFPLVILPQQVAETIEKCATESSLTVHRLRNNGKLYTAPIGLNDDLVCMIATVVDQHKSLSTYMDPYNEFRTCPILITNDRFLDHELKIRDRRLFRKWKQQYCHQYSHSIKMPPTENEFGRRIQCIDLPTDSSSGDNHSFDSLINNKVWYFPVQGWSYWEKLVISISMSKFNNNQA